MKLNFSEIKMDNVKSLTEKLNQVVLKALNGVNRAFLLLEDTGVAISYNKVIALHTNIYYAAYALINANKIEQIDLRGENSELPIFERTMHLQNAYITYNNCVDYIYQILYFYFDIEGVIRTSKSCLDIEKIEKELRGVKFIIIEDFIKNEKPVIYRQLQKFKKVSADLKIKSNKIKHRASFWIDGNHIENLGIVKKLINGVEVNMTELITVPKYNIIEEIEYLIIIHNELVELEKVIFEQLKYEVISNKLLSQAGLNKEK